MIKKLLCIQLFTVSLLTPVYGDDLLKGTVIGTIETVNYNLLGSGVALLVFGIIIFLMIIGRMNIQHNLVNKAFNVEKFLEESE